MDPPSGVSPVTGEIQLLNLSKVAGSIVVGKCHAGISPTKQAELAAGGGALGLVLLQAPGREWPLFLEQPEGGSHVELPLCVLTINTAICTARPHGPIGRRAAWA